MLFYFSIGLFKQPTCTDNYHNAVQGYTNCNTLHLTQNTVSPLISLSCECGRITTKPLLRTLKLLLAKCKLSYSDTEILMLF